jgi:hypothetical protein
MTYETRAHPGPPPGGAVCSECKYWLALEPVGAIAPPVDPQLAAYGQCRGRSPRQPGPVVQWPLTPALEPACGAYCPRERS